MNASTQYGNAEADERDSLAAVVVNATSETYGQGGGIYWDGSVHGVGSWYSLGIGNTLERK